MEHREYISLAFWARRRLQLLAAGDDQPADATEDQLFPQEAPQQDDLPGAGEPLAA